MRGTMHGISAHAFAAVMTLMVITFPSPTDLLRSLGVKTDEKVQEIKSFPNLAGEPATLDQTVAMEDFIPVVAACILPQGDTPAERRACDEALSAFDNPGEIGAATKRITSDQATVQVALAYFCRAEWADAQRNRRIFDTDNCLGSNLPLAQAVD